MTAKSSILITLCALSVVGLSSGTASAQTCYSPPFANPDLDDPWGCAAACGRMNPHRGLDYPEPCGTPIPAIADGVVVVNEYNGCLGYLIVLAHPDGMFSGYNHMPSASPLPVGASVARGAIVGVVGDEGSCSYGCHLHLTVNYTAAGNSEGSYATVQVDPYAWIQSHSVCDPGYDLLPEQPAAYAPPSNTDIDGDGRADMCARASDGVHCYPSTGSGWDPSWAPVPWTDAGTWNRPEYFATLRMGDINGDGRADLCIRSDSDVLCALSTGEGFSEPTVWLPDLSDVDGWNLPRYYTTIRLADVDGDGRDDLCARYGVGFRCWISDGVTFARPIEGPAWSDASGFDLARYYGTLRMGDLNGDGMADACIRMGVGMQCALSDGDGFPTLLEGPAWSDARGFTETQFWSTLRMGDVNGDGNEDLCIRTSVDYRCAFSTGSSTGPAFEPDLAVGALSDASGWADPTNYRTFRLGDVDGDGTDDICGRGDAEMACWTWTGTTFVQRAGPAWSDAAGWAASAAYYDTIRIADHDGDGRGDLCARSGAGWRCSLSTGDGFGDVVMTDQLWDMGGWATTPSYWSTIVSGGGCEASTETCNGQDDDCDRTVDEDTCNDGGGALRDAGAGRDGSMSRSSLTGGCSCRAASTSARPSAFSLLALGLLVLVRLRSRR